MPDDKSSIHEPEVIMTEKSTDKELEKQALNETKALLKNTYLKLWINMNGTKKAERWKKEL